VRSSKPYGRSFELGRRKEAERRGWCQSLHAIICAGKGNGSLLFHAFPQEIIDKIAEETGSRPVEVSFRSRGW